MTTPTASPSTPSTTTAPTTNNSVVRVGVGVLVQDPDDPHKVFCGIRKGSHGAGTLALPGGHLELYESWEQCALREVLEETNLELDETTLQLAHVTNDPMPQESKHYVTIFLMGKCRRRPAADVDVEVDPSSPVQQQKQQQQRPITMEPDKCEGWHSYSWKELQDKLEEGLLFGPLQRLVQASPSNVMEFLK
jgi:8-oxo-dGTP diphosphatase